MTTERPILMSAPMVRATLDDKKTKTRRVIVPQPEIKPVALIDRAGDPFTDELGRWVWSTGMAESPCPYGKPGDRLWVRETWHLWGPPERQVLEYRADCADPDQYTWRPSIYMPRAQSRLTLEILSVEVERVQEISDADILAEGFPEDPPSYAEGFAGAWNALNAKRGYSWESNPWVWVIEYRRVSQ